MDVSKISQQIESDEILSSFNSYLQNNLEETIYLDSLIVKKHNGNNQNAVANIVTNLFTLRESDIIFDRFLNHNDVRLLMCRLVETGNNSKVIVEQKLAAYLQSADLTDWVGRVNVFHFIGACSRLADYDFAKNIFKQINVCPENINDIVSLSLGNMSVVYSNEYFEYTNIIMNKLSINEKLRNFYAKYIYFYYGNENILSQIISSFNDPNRVALFLPIILSLGKHKIFPPSSKQQLCQIKNELSNYKIKLPSFIKEQIDLEGIVTTWDVA